jgi:hypothetical protein
MLTVNMENSLTSLGILSDPFTMGIICLSLAWLLFGFLIGRLYSRTSISKKIEEAVAKQKIELEENAAKEKAEISAQLGQELFKVRDSIIQSAKAYESTVKIIQEKLQPNESMEQLLIVGKNESQLALELQETEDIPVEQSDQNNQQDIEIEQDSQLEFEYTDSDNNEGLTADNDNNEKTELRAANAQ